VFTLKLHHIGLVVQNINESLGEIANFLSFESISLPTIIGSQKVNICFLKTNNVYIELIEPTEENSPITNFAKEGGGFHHLCFEVDDIQQEIDRMVKNGAHLVVAPVKGFEDRLLAFLMLNLKKTKCKLIELVETKR
jgi:methylmalonyl-CoA/ethylmalonyl-CoA epimerase|tara:strand:+ start:131 stop:541 length:411 start_codon:yes stop_codon:yes gene_type:complete